MGKPKKSKFHERRAEVEHLLRMSGVERAMEHLPVTMDEVAEYCGVGKTTVYEVKRGLESPKWNKDAVTEFPDMNEEERQQRVFDAIFKMVMNGNSNAAKLLMQFWGLLTEKHEVRIGLTADEIANRNLEADRRLDDFRRGGRHRMEDVQEGLPLLPDEIRESER